MRCTKKMKITADQFFRYLGDTLRSSLRLPEGAEPEVGRRYEIKPAGAGTNHIVYMTLTKYVIPEICEVEQETQKERRYTRYTVEALESGGILVKLESTLETRIKKRDGSVMTLDDSNNYAMGQIALMQKLQLRSLEKYIKKNY